MTSYVQCGWDIVHKAWPEAEFIITAGAAPDCDQLIRATDKFIYTH